MIVVIGKNQAICQKIIRIKLEEIFKYKIYQIIEPIIRSIKSS
jgi:hypothetical protein